MYLKWNSICYKCEAPLEPKIIVKGDLNKSFLYKYKQIRPIFMGNNCTFYSFVGLKLKRVCYSCFKNKVKIQPKLLRYREIGHIKNFAPRSKAKTREEIVLWFDGLLRSAYKNNLNIFHTNTI